jgi:hypothetical protein
MRKRPTNQDRAKESASWPKPPEPPRSAPEAQELLARVMLRVAEKHDDAAMRDAGERLARVAKRRPGHCGAR